MRPPENLDRGLSTAEVATRRARDGYNEIPEQAERLAARIARRFWGPIPWMIEVAALLSAMVQKWEDFTITIRIGSIVPADVTLTRGAYLQLDQSALTGDNLAIARQIATALEIDGTIREVDELKEAGAAMTPGQGDAAEHASEIHLIEQANVGDIYVYATAWFVVNDYAKVWVYRLRHARPGR